ncbi:MAG: alpha/beta hydrolase fold domain-containing protein [Micromonosporaceae bacterium]|nr:alpha/beta hydrolase fold domain-containing protein [Micromonosporaceae bacterium]
MNLLTATQAAAVRLVFSLPAPVRRALAGAPIRAEGQGLDLDMQLFLRLQERSGNALRKGDAEAARRHADIGDEIIRGPRVAPVDVRALDVPGAAGPMAARLYTPHWLAPAAGLLIYYHGGGWTVGSLDTHDNICRFLAHHAGVRVLSPAYRLAPEHPFPAAARDAYAAFEHAVEHAEELGVDPASIAVGGDSAGGNLAIVTALQAAESGGARPACQLLIYPATDHTVRRESRERYGRGFFLTDEEMTWFGDNYRGSADVAEPHLSPLHADLAELPPAYLAVAGFDPLRDEGLAFAEKLAEAGVDVTVRRFDDLIHGYANFFGFSRRAREAMGDAALALHRAIGAAAQEATAQDASRRPCRRPGMSA